MPRQLRKLHAFPEMTDFRNCLRHIHSSLTVKFENEENKKYYWIMVSSTLLPDLLAIFFSVCCLPCSWLLDIKGPYFLVSPRHFNKSAFMFILPCKNLFYFWKMSKLNVICTQIVFQKWLNALKRNYEAAMIRDNPGTVTSLQQQQQQQQHQQQGVQCNEWRRRSVHRGNERWLAALTNYFPQMTN
jgi:hypothetical protein